MSDSDEHSDDANDEDDAGNAGAVPTTADACVVSNDEDDNMEKTRPQRCDTAPSEFITKITKSSTCQRAKCSRPKTLI